MPPRVEGQLSDALIAALEDGVIGCDRNGCIRIFNGAACSIFSVKENEVLGELCWNVLPGGEFARALVSQIKDSDPEPVQRLMLFPDQRMFAVKMYAVRSERGRNLGAYAVLRDMSGVKRIERSLDDVFNSLTQELANPLTTIKGFVETLLEGAYLDTEVTRRFLQIINGEANNLVRLVMSLDSVVHVENDAQPVKARFRLEALLERCVDLFVPVASSKRVEITCDFADNLPWIVADEKLLHRAFLNLMDNAVRYVSVKGGGKVALRVFKQDRNLVTEIKDDGIGITAEDMPHIFERFYRGHSAEVVNLGGAGLGLTVAQSVVQAHKGVIKVESEPGKGSVFTVVLPIRLES